jgi:hypothetical protein
VGGATSVWVCRSTGLVEMLNATPKNRVGLVIASASEFPSASNGGAGWDW